MSDTLIALHHHPEYALAKIVGGEKFRRFFFRFELAKKKKLIEICLSTELCFNIELLIV